MIKTRKFRGDLGALYGGMFRFMCVCVCVCVWAQKWIWYDLIYMVLWKSRTLICWLCFQFLESRWSNLWTWILPNTYRYFGLYDLLLETLYRHFFCYMLTLRIMSVFTLLNKVCVPSVSHQFCNKRSTLPSWNY